MSVAPLLAVLLLLAPVAHSASGRTGPVGLELKLLKSKFKVGERLFVKMTLRNFSKSKDEMIVIDWIFRGADNLGDAWDKQLNSESGPTIEIQDSRGRRVKPSFFDVGIRYNDYEQSVKPFEGPDRELYNVWIASGFTPQQASDRLNKKWAWDAERAYSAKHPVVRLKQGESVSTLSWCAEREPGNTPLAVTCPGGGFVELPFFPFTRPGRFRIRAVYNNASTTKFKQWDDEWTVRVATAWTNFEVLK